VPELWRYKRPKEFFLTINYSRARELKGKWEIKYVDDKSLSQRINLMRTHLTITVPCLMTHIARGPMAVCTIRVSNSLWARNDLYGFKYWPNEGILSDCVDGVGGTGL